MTQEDTFIHSRKAPYIIGVIRRVEAYNRHQPVLQRIGDLIQALAVAQHTAVDGRTFGAAPQQMVVVHHIC